MKKFTFIFLGVIALAMTSCNPCVNCTSSLLPDQEICRQDFNTQQEYEDAIAVLEANTYTCN